MKKTYSFLEKISLPETFIHISQHLFSLDNTVVKAWNDLSNDVLHCYRIDAFERLQALLKWMYQYQGFSQASESYFSMSSYHLEHVLASKMGHSTTLAILCKSLAEQLDLKVELLLLPSDVMLSFYQEKTKEYHFFSALNGEPLSEHALLCFIRAEEGNLLLPSMDSYFEPATDEALIRRLLSEIKAVAHNEKAYEISFEICNILIAWRGRHTSLVRERAMLAQLLGCVDFASAEFMSLIEEEPDDPLIDFVKFKLHEMEFEHNVFH